MSLRRSRAFLFIVLWLGCAMGGHAAAAQAGAGAWLHRHVLEQGHPGAHLVVATADAAPVDLAVGSADTERRHPLRGDAIYRIYSMTKPVVSAAVLRLIGEGHGGLDDAVALHLPELAALRVLDRDGLRAPRRPPTLRHLLTHTAGFPVVPGQALLRREAVRLEDSDSLATYVARAARVPLAHDPGTVFAYDGMATEILGRLVEVWSGQPLGRYLDATFFEPLGMADTGFVVPEAGRGRVVELTCLRDGALVRADQAHARDPGIGLRPYASAAGGLYSTAHDYLAFARMLLAGGRHGDRQYLPRPLAEAMFRDQLAAMGLDRPHVDAGAGRGFGLGVSVLLDPPAMGRLGAPGQVGWSGAASTYFVIDPVRGRIGLLLLQHLPCGGRERLPSVALPFYNFVQEVEFP
ncbi:serine hydrolase domain-containing protein [Pseudoxanthomonas broegbernensis]|nr:serine hydrolase domain-containing protein [Pseudoxanthomonas broegbernensis]MBB6064064.1 CubicO group peptidase (beta-lactamase class C family) [Pseudoxanthomonas broegbernensis]